VSRSIAVLFNLVTEWGWVIRAMPWLLYPQERPGSHSVGGQVGPRAGLDGCGKSCPPPGFDPGPSNL